MSTPQQSSLPQARVKVPHPYLALMGLYLGAFTGMYSETSLNIALPQLSSAFGIDLSLTQWLVVGYMLVIGIVLPFASLLLKWVTARQLTLFALGAFLVGSLISGFGPNFEVTLIGRLIQGIDTGLILPTMFAMVLEVIPPHKIGAAMGVSALVIMFAPAIGPTLSGIILGALSWRWIFFSFAIVLFVGIVFALKFEVNPYKLTRPAIDPLSVIMSCLGFGGVVFGAGVASLFGWISAPTLGALLIGIVCLAIYAKRQFSMKVPVIDLHVFGLQGFRVGAICMMLNFGITLSAMYVLPQFYQNGMLLAVAFTGIVMLPGGIVNAIVSMFAGNLFDKIGARIPALIGFAFSLVGACLLLLTTPQTSLGYVIMCHIIMMIGVPLAMSPCQSHALASLPHQLSTDGSTMLNTMQQVLGAVCTAAATSLLAIGQSAYFTSGGTDSALAFTQGSHYGFFFTFVLAFLGLLFALRIKKPTGAGASTGEHQSARNESAQPQSACSSHSAGTSPAVMTASTAAGIACTPEDVNPVLEQLMKRDVYAISETESALDALKLFAEKGISGAPVMSADGKLVGFVSDGDIIGTISHQHPTFTSFYAVAEQGRDEQFDEKLAALQNTVVGELATKNVLSVKIGDDMRDVCTLLTTHHLKKAPVLDQGKMVGMINRSDITRYVVDRFAAAD